MRKRVFWASVAVTVACSAVLIAGLAINTAYLWGVLCLLLVLWTLGFVLVWVGLWLLVATYLYMQIHCRCKEIEAVLPDYLRVVAANIRAGMAIDRALWFAVRPRFGILAKEIEFVAKRVLTGEKLADAVKDFSQQYDSPTLKRSVILLLEGIAAGGEIADVSYKNSTDISEQRILQQELSANVTTYVICITFASIIAPPVLFGLSRQLLVVIQQIVDGIDIDKGTGMFSVSGDVVSLSDLAIFAVVLLLGTSVLCAMIVSTIKRGSVTDGLRLLPTFAAVSIVLFFVSLWLFGFVFGNII